MNKTKKRLKRYKYISQSKIDMYDQQIDTNWFTDGLKSWFTKVIRIKIFNFEIEKSPSDTPAERNKIAKIMSRLEKENAIGTVDAPAEYIKDVLPMFYRLIPSRPSYQRLKNDPGFVYFGGSTERTIIALVGSPFHLIGRVKDMAQEPSSDLPLLVAYINERLGEIIDDYNKEYDHGLFAIQHADAFNHDLRIPMEFAAYRILDSAELKNLDMSEHKRILLYTPLYVAYASGS